MSKTTTEHKKTLARYSQPYKDEALALAESGIYSPGRG